MMIFNKSKLGQLEYKEPNKNVKIFLDILLVLSLSTAVHCEQNQIIEDFFKIFHSLINPDGDFDELIRLKDSFLADSRDSPPQEDDLDSMPYFKFMPKFVSTLAPNTETNLKETCFGVAKVCYQYQDPWVS